MQDTTDRPTVMDKVAEAWNDLELGVKVALSWLAVVLIGLIVVGIIFPIAGLVMLGVVVFVGTLTAILYLLEY